MDDIYHAETERSFKLESTFLEDSEQISDATIFLKVFSVLFVRAGLFLSQISSIPSCNIQVLIFQNIIDISVNTVIYALLGYLFAFGKDAGSFIGIEGFLSDKSNRNDFAEGWLIVIAVSGLLMAAIGDRISFLASVILNMLISAFVFPIIIHWILSQWGWMRFHTLNKIRVSYKDYSYSCLIHMSGGFLASVSMLILNKRLMRFKDMDVCAIPDNGPSLALFGNLCMIIGFFGVGVPNKEYLYSHFGFNYYGVVLVNMLLSAFGSVLLALLLTFSCPCEPLHKWTSMRSIQAGISGIAVIAGGADVYYPTASILIGLCNGSLFYLVSFLVNMSAIEDYTNIIPCHLVSGFIGTLLPPIFGIRDGFNTSVGNNFVHFTWQLLCNMAIVGFIALIFVPLIYLLDFCGVLRSWEEDINHRRAVLASKKVKEGGPDASGFDWRGNNQNVQYLEPGYKPKSSQNEVPEFNQETVDVLFEKKSSLIGTQGETRDNFMENFVVASTTNNQCFEMVGSESESKEMISSFSKSKEVRFINDDKYVVNYVVNSKPMIFFEELSWGSRHTSETAVKSSGDNLTKNSKFFDLKMIKGIKNISDSRLFQKFKDNWSVPKRRTAPTRDRELRVGSMSNIWVSSDKINLETSV